MNVTFDYERQVWLDEQGNVLPCAHPASMGERCCMAYVLTGVRRCQACAADDADIGVFDHGSPHVLGAGCDLTERDLCEHGDGRVGNHVFHGKEG